LAQICENIKLKNIQGLTLTDFEGKVTVKIPEECSVDEHMKYECLLLRECYLGYAEHFLGSHRIYCDKFLTTINRFEHHAGICKSRKT
jgi:hypothetical protein